MLLLTPQFRWLYTGFRLFQNAHNLLFRVAALLHPVVLCRSVVGLSRRRTLTLT